jgi:prevent-host-death family protein
MKKVAATEAKNRLGALIDDAQREPVIIQRQERDVAVLVSMRDFERLRQMNVSAFLEARNTVAAEAKRRGLTEKKLAALLADED